MVAPRTPRTLTAMDPIYGETPSAALERAEEQPSSDHIRELSDSLGRILCWLLAGRFPARIGFRAYIIAYVLRPDLINGMTLTQIGALSGCGKTFAHKLVINFRQTFGITGANARPHASRIHRKAWKRAHPKAKTARIEDSHQNLVNRFEHWLALIERSPEIRPSPQTLKRDLRTLIEFVHSLEEVSP